MGIGYLDGMRFSSPRLRCIPLVIGDALETEVHSAVGMRVSYVVMYTGMMIQRKCTELRGSYGSCILPSRSKLTACASAPRRV